MPSLTGGTERLFSWAAYGTWDVALAAAVAHNDQLQGALTELLDNHVVTDLRVMCIESSISKTGTKQELALRLVDVPFGDCALQFMEHTDAHASPHVHERLCIMVC